MTEENVKNMTTGLCGQEAGFATMWLKVQFQSMVASEKCFGVFYYSSLADECDQFLFGEILCYPARRVRNGKSIKQQKVFVNRLNLIQASMGKRTLKGSR